MPDTKEDSLANVGKCALGSIRDMVAALECDYDRLEELRDERNSWEPEEYEEGSGKLRPCDTWAAQQPDDAQELADLETVAGECKDHLDAQTRIEEDPLSIEYRSGWETDRSELQAVEAKILLTTGGPDVQIIVELDDGQPSRAYMQVQDWGTPWTDYYEEGIGDLLMSYVGVFCFE